jgi:hypothetical protein
MNTSAPAKSTHRDAILFYASGFKPGLHLALSSLISTGAQCRIVLFVSSDFSISPRFRAFVKRYGIEIVEHCDSNDGRPLFGHMLRYEYEAKWIERNIHQLDRVMHSDSYDVFFQADPFQDLVPHDRLLLVVEDFEIFMCDWNSQWIRECYGNDTWYEIKMHNIICTGIICGNADAYMRMIKVMIKRPEWKYCWMPSKDQPIFNNLLWTGVFAYHGFQFNYTNCFHGIFTMHWCQGKAPLRWDAKGLLVTPQGDVPFLLHQYNRYQEAIDKLTAECGMAPFPKV